MALVSQKAAKNALQDSLGSGDHRVAPALLITVKAEIFGSVIFSDGILWPKSAVRWREIFGKTHFPGKCTSTKIQYR